MTQSLLLNIISFTPPQTEKTFAFYLRKKEPHYCPIHKDDIQGLLTGVIDEEELEYGNWLYTDFQDPQEDAIVLNVNLVDHPYFGLHYYRYLLEQYFTGRVGAVRRNYTKELEVWVQSPKESTGKYNIYFQFTLKVQHARVTDGPELVLSFDGKTKVLKQSVQEITRVDTSFYNWILYDGRLYRWKYFPTELKSHLDKAYPVLSNTLKPHFDIAFDIPTPKNRYNPHYDTLLAFYKKYINTAEFRTVIPVSEKGFLQPDPGLVSRISTASNELVYGNGALGNDPKKDFKYKGPYMQVPPPNNVKFFFIYHKPERYTAVRAIYEYFLNGFQGQWPFPSMQQYIRLPFLLDTAENSIAYDSLDSAVQAVRKAIRNKEKQPDTRYFAIYINPVPKFTTDKKADSIYYQIKELLLHEGISCQVVKSQHLYNKELAEEHISIAKQNNGAVFHEKQFSDTLFSDASLRQKIYNQDFNTFLPHIEIAILAKLGGVPWRLNRPTTNELIVGVGAFYSISKKTRFVGSAFCFNNEGIFKGFDCFNSKDTSSLTGSIREAVGKFLAVNYKATRLIIHFYKDIGKKELKPIVDTLHTLGLNIPVVIVSINKTESKELVAFDMAYKEKMPYSGTSIKVGRNEYLLFNNTRYDETSIPKKKEFHFPIKIYLSSTDPQLLANKSNVDLFIDQVYQFSRMYWKSTDQQSLPVTIKYPEMVAKIYPYFNNDYLPEYGKNNLWFL